MQLIDFNISTNELRSDLVMQVEFNAKRHFISELVITDSQQLILKSNTHLPALTLAQFNTRCRKLDSHVSLYYQDSKHPLFGYRLDGKYILLG
ncbi:hypothetical protein [Paucilactobacillus kaifaensis]|uniref:hypothetical protein n=1 Tax=Paucilactobacillus kaifaensis TaxID=2559921 RepID=UPI0010F4761F|nr:hypothetical protein [Paucilactobacillus kaifaensis]